MPIYEEEYKNFALDAEYIEQGYIIALKPRGSISDFVAKNHLNYRLNEKYCKRLEEFNENLSGGHNPIRKHEKHKIVNALPVKSGIHEYSSYIAKFLLFERRVRKKM